MTDDPGIRPIIAAVLSAMLLFFIVPAEAASVPHQKGSFTAVFEQYSPLSDTNSILKRTRVRPKHGRDKKHRRIRIRMHHLLAKSSDIKNHARGRKYEKNRANPGYAIALRRLELC